MIAGAVFAFYGVIGTLVAGLDAFMSIYPTQTEFTPAEGSRPISSTLKIDGHEVTLPCTVTDIQRMGYTTDYDYFSGNIKMWPIEYENGLYPTPNFQVYIDDSYGYENDDHVSGDDQVAAVKIKNDYKIKIEFDDVKFNMSRDALIETYGPPAYENGNSTQGYFLYYEGENDTIYRFHFDSLYTLVGIMYGTSDFMENAMRWMYY